LLRPGRSPGQSALHRRQPCAGAGVSQILGGFIFPEAPHGFWPAHIPKTARFLAYHGLIASGKIVLPKIWDTPAGATVLTVGGFCVMLILSLLCGVVSTSYLPGPGSPRDRTGPFSLRCWPALKRRGLGPAPASHGRGQARVGPGDIRGAGRAVDGRHWPGGGHPTYPLYDFIIS
jgi:hypothetical protein